MSVYLSDSLKHKTLHPTQGTTENGVFRYHDGIIDIHWPHGLMSVMYNKFLLPLVGSPESKKFIATYQDHAAQFLLQQFPEFKLFMEEAHLEASECTQLIKETTTFKDKTTKLQPLSEKSSTKVYLAVCERYLHNITKDAYTKNPENMEAVLDYANLLNKGQGTSKDSKQAYQIIENYINTHYSNSFDHYKADLYNNKPYFSFPISNPAFYETLAEVSLNNNLFFETFLAAIAMLRFDNSPPSLKAQKIYSLAYTIKCKTLVHPMTSLDQGIPEIQQTTLFLLTDLAHNLNPIHPNYTALHDYALRQSFDKVAQDLLGTFYRTYTGNGLQRYLYSQAKEINPASPTCA